MTTFSISESSPNLRSPQILEEDPESGALNGMVGTSAPMRRLSELIAKVAPTDATVLIHGETGTGKELAARAIHFNSRRSGGPLVAINCAAIPEPLLESELFGYVRGAFTGAGADKKGKLELADRGTLFLDEIGELPLGLQAKLLRAIQERECDRLGSAKPIRVDVRIVAATNADLAVAVASKTFRQDLYYRLAVVALRTPPLRERCEDILPLSEYFLSKLSAGLGRMAPAISADTAECMRRYHWPGNIRELQNTLEHAIVFGMPDTIRAQDLPEVIRWARTVACAPCGAATYDGAVDEFKRRLILETLDRTGGSYLKAAKILEIHPNSLHRLVQKLGLRDRLTRRTAGNHRAPAEGQEDGIYCEQPSDPSSHRTFGDSLRGGCKNLPN